MASFQVKVCYPSYLVLGSTGQCEQKQFTFRSNQTIEEVKKEICQVVNLPENMAHISCSRCYIGEGSCICSVTEQLTLINKFADLMAIA
mmetsp:Transcript_6134/g.9846  ORF Transcript_6134/g.9846 Transcript_6134/m.9846 type:complete len:89 (-) Transcript_6134:1549-1815(-)